MGLERLEDRQLLATFTVTNVADGGLGSLRAAINNSNSTPGADRIVFSIGSGQQTINLGSGLPTLVDTVTIDGTTQPGFKGTPLIELNGANAIGTPNGLRIAASGCTIMSLSINRFAADGILVESSNATLQGNFIGIGPSGTVALPNKGYGVEINGGAGNSVGIPGTGNSNVISANALGGVRISGSSATNNRVQNNYIGTDSSGGNPLGNGGDGIAIVTAGFNILGGPTTDLSNTISGNQGYGVRIVGTRGNSLQANFIGTSFTGATAIPNSVGGVLLQGTTGNLVGGSDSPTTRNVISGNSSDGILVLGGQGDQILNNLIGTAADGKSNLGNGGAGIYVQGSSRITIGGTRTNEANTIAFNGVTFSRGGVDILAGVDNPILGNSIFLNNGLGIDLGDDGPTLNDVGDPDSGPNNLQNFPNLTAVVSGAGRTQVQGSLNSKPNTTFLLQFFSSPAADPSGYGEGKTYLATQLPVTVTTDSTGNATFTLTLGLPVVVGNFLSATATEIIGTAPLDTSEFSPAVPVGQATIADLSVTVSDSPDPATLGADYTYTITVRNNSAVQDATNVVLTASLPSDVTFKSATVGQGSYTQAGTDFKALLGTIPAGGAVNVTIVVTPNAVGKKAMTVTVTSDQIDTDPTNNTVTEQTTVTVPADLSLTINDSADPVVEGGEYSYVVIVTNNGPGAATGVVLTTTLPAGAAFVSASSGQGTSGQPIQGKITFNLQTINSGSSVAARVTLKAGTVPPDADSQSVTFAASVMGDQVDPNPGNNADTEPTIVRHGADLALVMVATPDPVLAGQPLTYRLTVTNNGPSQATNVVVTDNLPAGVVLNNVDFPFAFDPNGNLAIQVGTLNSGTSAVVTILTTAPDAAGSITNTASVHTYVDPTDTTSDQVQIDPNEADNTATTTTPVSPADLALTLTANPTTATIGLPLVYTATVTNNGPADATGVQLAVQLPDGLTINSATTDVPGVVATVNGQLVTVVYDTLLVGPPVHLTISTTPHSSVILTATAAVDSAEDDNNPANNTATVDVAVSPADLGVTITPSGNNVVAGSPLVYRIDVTNNGPSVATGVVAYYALPGNINLLSLGTSQGSVAGSPGLLTASFGTIAAGQTATLTVVVSPTGAATLDSRAVVVSDLLDPNPGNDSDSSEVRAINLPGSLTFSVAGYVVDEGAGTATITVLRQGGTLGVVSINYAAYAGTAISGVDFSGVDGTLVFNDGEQVKTFTVPLIDNSLTQPDRTINLILGLPTGGAGVGPLDTSTIVVKDNDPDLTGPTVVDIGFLGGRQINAVVLAFSEYLDPSRAIDPSNYAILAPAGRVGRTAVPARIVPVSASYNPGNNTVTLVPATPLDPNVFYGVIVNGSGPNAVTDLKGNPLNGQGVNGTNLIASFARGTSLSYTDGDGDVVSLSLRGGGLMDVIRGGSGEAQSLRVFGTRPARSVISGRVRPGGLGSDGRTSLGKVVGLLPPFARVRSTLQTPPFISDNLIAQAAPTAIDQLMATVSVADLTPTARRRRGG